ncbi:hypothetical protein J6590_061048 [Homalodisca vitripennis]|nr:hypothetical protein J6590_061048 [Homalodisca vitripennis]
MTRSVGGGGGGGSIPSRPPEPDPVGHTSVSPPSLSRPSSQCRTGVCTPRSGVPAESSLPHRHTLTGYAQSRGNLEYDNPFCAFARVC